MIFYRTIIFVRHAQYQKDPEELTALGREQARLLATALVPHEATKLYSSNMPRAIETAEFIRAVLDLPISKKSFFGESLLPGPTDFMKEKGANREELKENKLRADKAFEYLFDKPVKENSKSIVVAHGNVIRHWVTCALGIDAKKWLLMDVQQGSFTIIRQSSEGKFTLLGFADCGHIPFEKRSYI